MDTTNISVVTTIDAIKNDTRFINIHVSSIKSSQSFISLSFIMVEIKSFCKNKPFGYLKQGKIWK